MFGDMLTADAYTNHSKLPDHFSVSLHLFDWTVDENGRRHVIPTIESMQTFSTILNGQMSGNVIRLDDFAYISVDIGDRTSCSQP